MSASYFVVSFVPCLPLFLILLLFLAQTSVMGRHFLWPHPFWLPEGKGCTRKVCPPCPRITSSVRNWPSQQHCKTPLGMQEGGIWDLISPKHWQLHHGITSLSSLASSLVGLCMLLACRLQLVPAITCNVSHELLAASNMLFVGTSAELNASAPAWDSGVPRPRLSGQVPFEAHISLMPLNARVSVTPGSKLFLFGTF